MKQVFPPSNTFYFYQIMCFVFYIFWIPIYVIVRVKGEGGLKG